MKITKMLNISIIAAYIIILILITSFIYPFVNNEIRIYEPEGFHYYIKSGNLIASAMIHIENSGPYSINNVSVKYSFLNNTTVISEGNENLPSIEGNYFQNITFIFNITKLYNEGVLAYLIFHSTMLKMKLHISGSYAGRFIQFHIDKNISIPWNRLAYITIGKESVSFNSTSFFVLVPVNVDTASFLSGNATLISDLFLNGSLIGKNVNSIPLGINYSFLLNFTFPKSQEEHLMENIGYMELENTLIIFNTTIPAGVIK